MKRRLRIAALAVMAVLAAAACSQPGTGGGEYPQGSLDYVVPFSPGGSTDPVGREFVRQLADVLGTSAVVENMPGGDQAIGIAHVLDADPDGQTLGLATPSGLIVQPKLHDNLAYRGIGDATPIIKMMTGPYALLVAADSPYKSLDEFIAAAKNAPGALRVGTTARISDNSFALFALEDEAGIKTTMVPFPGGAGESVLALLGGEIDAIMATASGQLGMVQSGDLRALAHTGTSKYNRFLPGAVSFSDDAGLDVTFASQFMTIAPAGLPDDVRADLTAAALEVANGDEWKNWCEQSGILPDNLTGDELDAFLADMDKRSQRALQLADEREK